MPDIYPSVNQFREHCSLMQGLTFVLLSPTKIWTGIIGPQ